MRLSIWLKVAIAVTAFLVTTVTGAIAQEVLSVDFARDLGPATYRASGFLHPMSTTEPALEMIKPLKPGLFRMREGDHKSDFGAFATYDRATNLGAKVQLVLSDSYDVRGAGGWPGDNGSWKPWEDMIDRIVRDAREAGYRFYWDVWNEPDGGTFWRRDRAQFFDTWRQGVRKIRSLDPNALVVGPSMANYSAQYLDDFLLYAKQNNVLPDYLSWHEFHAPSDIPGHVAQAREFMAQHGISVKGITINEIMDSRRSMSPGMTACYLANLERAQIDGACHACWGDSWNRTLSGVLTYPDRRPRATWWVYKTYADITGQLVDVTPSASIDGIAGGDRDRRVVRVLLGRIGEKKADTVIRFVNMKAVPYVIWHNRVHVTIERIPPSGRNELPAPQPAVDAEYPIEHNEMKVPLTGFGPSDALVLTLTRKS